MSVALSRIQEGRRKERWTKEGLYLFREKLWTVRMRWMESDLWLGRIRGQQVVSCGMTSVG